jgi:hypothetical protein
MHVYTLGRGLCPCGPIRMRDTHAMGTVEWAVRQSLRSEAELVAPGQARLFEVAELDQDGIVLLLARANGVHASPGTRSKDWPICHRRLGGGSGG